MEASELKQIVLDEISQQLEVPVESLSLNEQKSAIPQWDSFSHLNIILGLQKKFSIKFSVDEVQSDFTISELIQMIESKQS